LQQSTHGHADNVGSPENDTSFASDFNTVTLQEFNRTGGSARNS
jgi:hypothetical protein